MGGPLISPSGGRLRLGLVGLGVMGSNLALNLRDHGVSTVVWNLDPEVTRVFVEQNAQSLFTCAQTLRELAAQLEAPRKILLMVQAGQPVDDVLAELLPSLSQGDVIVDGGNSHYADTRRRELHCKASGIHFVGMGVSGGEAGARHGPSLMPGGSAEAYAELEPILGAIAAKNDLGACVTWVGPGAAGHFVKMVHNGVEYAEMQLLAEAYDLLSRGLELTAGEIAKVFERFNSGPLRSFLMELSARVLEKLDPVTGAPLVDSVLDQAGQKGTGRWTLEAALALGVPIPSINESLTARGLSSIKEQRVAASTLLRGRPLSISVATDAAIEDLEAALVCSKWASYAQGFSLLAAASETYDWKLNFAEIARIWTGGCILRAELLRGVMQAFHEQPRLPNLLMRPEVEHILFSAQAGWRKTVVWSVSAGLPTPVMSASLSYFDSYRSARLPQNLTQAQRDAFGAHTYQRTDQPQLGFVHSEWLKQ